MAPKKKPKDVGNVVLGDFQDGDDLLDKTQASDMSAEGKLIVSTIISYFNNILKKKEDQIDRLQKNIGVLESRVEWLEDQVDSNSAYERRDTLILSGALPAVQQDERCDELVRQLVRDQLRINLHETDISTAHRLGKKPKQQGPDHRRIIFKLCRRDTKTEILNSCRQHKPNFFINESLTATRNTILYALRQARKKNPNRLGSCRSSEGNVCVWLPAEGQAAARDPPTRRFNRIIVNTRRKLDEILSNQIGCTSEAFVAEWPNERSESMRA